MMGRMTDSLPPEITDWATDFDHAHPDYARAAPEIWADLRDRCPVAHSQRYGGTWLPTRHAEVEAIAKDVENFTSQGVLVTEWRPDIPPPVGYAPPITSDPPFHATARQFLLSSFSPKAVRALEESARVMCRELLDDLLESNADVVDAARQYAQHIPVRVIADMLGVPREDGDMFRVFIHRILETPGVDYEIEYEDTLDAYLDTIIAARQREPRDDLISHMVQAEVDGQPLTPEHVRGTCGLLLIAGIDTTWSAIGASLWHLAQHPHDRRRWTSDPEVRPFAIEEFLRYYAPVTMARLVANDTSIGGVAMKKDEWVLLPFPAANRDPAFFDNAETFVIDRQRNRHAAFGLGIHRCVGSNLARLELTVAIDEWMRRIPDFELADPDAVQWSAGQIRGPRQLPVRVLSNGEAS